MSISTSIHTYFSQSTGVRQSTDVSSVPGRGYDVASTITSGDISVQDDIRKYSTLRQVLHHVCESKYFTLGLLFIIIVNTVILALQSEGQMKLTYGWYFSGFDSVFLGIYVMEAMMKLFVYRLGVLRDGWSIFDLFVVLTSLATILLPLWTLSLTTANSEIFRLFRLFRAIRAIRSLRILRTIKFFGSLQIILATLLKSIPAMGNICILTILVLYTATVIATSLFAKADPQRFEGIGQASWTLFQLATLDNWSSIYIENREKIVGMFAFTFVYIILMNFVFINLFVAVIVDNMQSMQTRAQKKSEMRGRSGAFVEDIYDIDGGSPHTSLAHISNPVNISWSEPPSDGTDSSLRAELGIDNYYGSSNSVDTKHEFAKYYMLLASLESNYLLHEHQQKILNDMVRLLDDWDSPESRRSPPGPPDDWDPARRLT